MNDIKPTEVIKSINECINWKTSARKSYIRKKIIDNDNNDNKDDYTQLCYEYHKLLIKNKFLEEAIVKIKIKELIEDDIIYE